MNNIVESKRIQYTASRFAKESLIYLQEVGYSKTLKKHTNSRKNMDSYLFLAVVNGNGQIKYEKCEYTLKAGECVFIDCRKEYSHTSDNWTIAWIHFNGNNVSNIYLKYLERNGRNIFKTRVFQRYTNQIDRIFNIANSNEYLKDMIIYSELVDTLNMIMSETIYPKPNTNKIKYDIDSIKTYIDNNLSNEISLDTLSSLFFINKYYLTRVFKDKYGITINNYISEKRITRSKELLRFTDDNIERISNSCGINDPNYFSRLFKKIEGITPKEYRKMW